MKLTKDNMNRVLQTHSRAKRTFIQHLMKSEYAVISESYPEYYGNILKDLEKNTKCMTTQPLTSGIPFIDRYRDVTADTLILTVDDKFELIEWKEEAKYLERKDHYDNVKAQYDATGLVTYRVLTEKYIWQQPRLKNSLAIHRIAMSSSPENKDVIFLRNALGDDVHGVGEIQQIMKKCRVPIQALWWLIGRQYIDIDRASEINHKTPINWSKDHEI